MLRVPRTTAWMRWILLLLMFPVANAAPQQVSAPIRQIVYEEAFQPGSSLPKWEQGYLVSWQTDTLSSDTAENLFLRDRDGAPVGKARIWLEGARLLRIEDAAARKDGRVAVVGWAVTNSGTLAAFLADVSLTRDSAQIIQTSPFEGQAVGFGPDGTIWVLGLEVGPGRGKEPAPNHYMVQHFGTDDVRKAQYLLQSDFGCELAAKINGIPRVVASDDRIGLFAPFCHMWGELSSTGELLGQWKWNPLSPVRNGVETAEGITSVALTATNEIYGWSSKSRALFRFDRKATVWVPLDTGAARSAGAPFTALLGTDGDALVSYTVAKKVGWFKPTLSGPAKTQ
jgi:hypothetical protein